MWCEGMGIGDMEIEYRGEKNTHLGMLFWLKMGIAKDLVCW